MNAPILSRQVITLTIVICIFLSPAILQGCDHLSKSNTNNLTLTKQTSSTFKSYKKLRHPHLLAQAETTFLSNTDDDQPATQTHLLLAFKGYEADGITARTFNRTDVTRHLLNQYGNKIRLKVSMNMVFDGLSISISTSALDQFLTDLNTNPDIAWAEPDIDITQKWFISPNKTTYKNQLIPWGVSRIGGGFAGTTPKQNIHVFVMDTGINPTDLTLGMQLDFTPLYKKRHLEPSENPHFSNLPTYNPRNAGNPRDNSGHGTHVAGTIAASDNNTGLLGAFPDLKLHSIKVLNDQGQTDITTITAAIDYVTRIKMERPEWDIVVNMSFAVNIGTSSYNLLDEAVARSIEAGVVYVVSAGSNSEDAQTYSPAHVDGAITVGAYNKSDEFAVFSNFGPAVDLLAPGENVVSLSHLKKESQNNEYVIQSGNSFATPHVTAAAIAFLTQTPNATPARVKQGLIEQGREIIRNVPAQTTSKTVYMGDFFRERRKDKAFKISTAKYNRKQNVLELSGEGPRHEQVVIKFASGDIFQQLTTDLNANWQYVAQHPADIPCSVTVTLNGKSKTRNVAYAPTLCR